MGDTSVRTDLGLEALVKRYRGFTLGPVDASIPMGVTGLLGANGAGKTTLLRLVVGTMPPSSGKVLLPGTGTSAVVGFLPQDFTAPARVSARDYMLFVAWCRSNGRHRVTEAHVADALDAVGLASKADAKVGALSGGMQRRLGIAQALLGGSQLLVFDEPTVGLDPIQRQDMRELIRRMGERAVVFMSTHLAEDIVAVASSVIVLDGGVMVYDGSIGGLCGARQISAESLEAGFLHVVGEGRSETS